jgi:outer membrane lipoprotein-sorting protein
MLSCKDLDKWFSVKTLSDPKLAKTERTINPKLDDQLEPRKEGEEGKKPESRVDHYVFELKPKEGGGNSGIQRDVEQILIQMDAEKMIPTMMSIELKDGTRLMVFVVNIEKLELKDVPDSMFAIDLTNYKNADE